MTILNKTFMAALVSSAIGFVAPAAAQSSVTVIDPDEPAVTVITKAPADTAGPAVVARADGSTVVTERVVRRRLAVPTACNFNNTPNVSGGLGGAIGGRMILGTTSADDIPIPG